ncbi:hypothetical protein [Alloalcanivorax xenomutans]|uniref:hypothetical protein n=1 Tax=Alloalcanivorax xenomutans TaxID=1094342 RepID=UPI0009B68EB8|nr:hypothetical protein [Alloalcanivorax xenomutans]ARB44245.1 hypothetical protein P40_01470 [Alloalcanivorax xenomutans]MCE7524418.1 hypothetical protein [Alloalcanivorax xenomutans]
MRVLVAFCLLLPVLAMAEESACYGTTSKGRLSGGVKLPLSGGNFESYSAMAHAAGRTYVHSEVRDIVVSAYKDLEKAQPEKVYKYAEYLRGNIQFSTRRSWVRHDEHYHVDFDLPCEQVR